MVIPNTCKGKDAMRYLVIVFLFISFFASCDNFISQDKYQIAASTDGNIYRLDKSSGEIWLIKGNFMEKVRMKYFRLKIGRKYVGEDGYSFTYLGKGQVGAIKTLDDFYEDKKK